MPLLVGPFFDSLNAAGMRVGALTSAIEEIWMLGTKTCLEQRPKTVCMDRNR